MRPKRQKESPVVPAAPPSLVSRILNSPKPVILVYSLLLLFPIYWSFKYEVPSIQDLPYHLANTSILLKHHFSPFFQKYFVVRYLPYPYLLQDIILSVLMVGGVTFASNAFLAITLVSIPLGLLYLIKTINPKKLHVSFFALPFIWNIMFMKGNMNYLLGVAISFVCLALLWKNLFVAPGTRKQWLLFSAWFVLLYLAHLVALMLFLCLAAVLVSVWLIKKKKFTVLIICIACAVTGLLALILYLRHSSANVNSTLPSVSERIAFLTRALCLFKKEDFTFLLPVLILLFALILPSLVRFKENPLPFLLCGTLGLIYFVVPSELGPLVRPPERVYYMLLFLLPICCLTQKYLALEKTIVMALCAFMMIHVFNWVSNNAEANSYLLGKYRTLLQNIPKEKKLMPVQMNGAYSGHIEAYYVIDRDGYVPSLFSTPYMMVNYREKPAYSQIPAAITYNMLCQYDYLMVFGDRTEFEKNLNKIWFTLVEREDFQYVNDRNIRYRLDTVAVYKNTALCGK